VAIVNPADGKLKNTTSVAIARVSKFCPKKWMCITLITEVKVMLLISRKKCAKKYEFGSKSLVRPKDLF
jgi:hypothetical protein